MSAPDLLTFGVDLNVDVHAGRMSEPEIAARLRLERDTPTIALGGCNA
jgi:hypothetical protein